MSPVQEALGDHLAIRRQLGFEMPQDGRLLEGLFVNYIEQAGASGSLPTRSFGGQDSRCAPAPLAPPALGRRRRWSQAGDRHLKDPRSGTTFI